MANTTAATLKSMIYFIFASVVALATAFPTILTDTAAGLALDPTPTANCVVGSPAVKASVDGNSWDINYFNVTPVTSMSLKNLGVDKTWSSQHAVVTMSLSGTPGSSSDQYGVFKCQYTCNGAPGCVSYFARYVSLDASNGQNFECVGYNALLSPSLYAEDGEKNHRGVGGFNKICGN